MSDWILLNPDELHETARLLEGTAERLSVLRDELAGLERTLGAPPMVAADLGAITTTARVTLDDVGGNLRASSAELRRRADGVSLDASLDAAILTAFGASAAAGSDSTGLTLVDGTTIDVVPDAAATSFGPTTVAAWFQNLERTSVHIDDPAYAELRAQFEMLLSHPNDAGGGATITADVGIPSVSATTSSMDNSRRMVLGGSYQTARDGGYTGSLSDFQIEHGYARDSSSIETDGLG